MKKKALFYLLFCMLPFVGFTQWSDNPSENTMINDSSGSQVVPMVVSNSIGESYISWYSVTEGNRYDVFLQKVDDNGNKLWDDAGLLISNHETMSWVTTYDMILDNDENVILATQDIRTGSSNVFAYKISPDGDFLWGNDGIQLSNSPSFNPSPKIVLAENNDAVFMFGSDPPDTLLNSSVFVMRVSPDGSLLWETTLSDTAYDYMLPQILHTSDDAYIVSFMTKTNLPDTIPGQEHFMHAFAQKLDAAGSFVWENKVQIDSGNIMLYLSLYTQAFLASDNNGGAYVLWQSFTPMGNDGNPTAYINRVYADGNIWTPNGYNVSQLKENHHSSAKMIYMTGLDQLMVCWQEYHYDGVDCWGINGQMFDPDGQYLWADTGKVIIPLNCAVDSSYQGLNLRESTNNNAVLTYVKDFFSIDNGDTSLRDYIYAIAIDANGNPIWEDELRALSLSHSYKLQPVMSNLVNKQWVLVWADNIENPHDGFDTGIYAQNISIEGEIGPLGIPTNPEADAMGIYLFPNPVHNQVNISYNVVTDGLVILDLLDINGRFMKQLSQSKKVSGTYSHQLNVSDLNPGMFLIRLQSGNRIIYQKMIKN